MPHHLPTPYPPRVRGNAEQIFSHPGFATDITMPRLRTFSGLFWVQCRVASTAVNLRPPTPPSWSVQPITQQFVLYPSTPQHHLHQLPYLSLQRHRIKQLTVFDLDAQGGSKCSSLLQRLGSQPTPSSHTTPVHLLPWRPVPSSRTQTRLASSPSSPTATLCAPSAAARTSTACSSLSWRITSR